MAAPTAKMDAKHLLVRLSLAEHEALRRESFENRLTMNAIVRRAIQDHFRAIGRPIDE